jgi:hypothetical protein
LRIKHDYTTLFYTKSLDVLLHLLPIAAHLFRLDAFDPEACSTSGFVARMGATDEGLAGAV